MHPTGMLSCYFLQTKLWEGNASQVCVCSQGLGISGPMSFSGDGYLWYQVLPGDGYLGVDGYAGGRGIQRVGIGGEGRWVLTPGY